MDRIQKMFLIVGLIGPIHMIEQLVFGIDEFYFLKSSLAPYYAWFPAAAADWATVLLITINGAILTAVLYAFLLGGRARLAALALFALLGVSEIHHLVEAIVRGGYDPGVATSIPYAWFGWQLLQSVWSEFKRSRETQIGEAAVFAAGFVA
jgi:hypothetical protein